MPKGYWITTYRAIRHPEKLAAYAKLAGPAVEPLGARYLVRGAPAKTFENGLMQRIVVSEFDSVDKAIAAHDSPGYQAALTALADGADRDIRIVEGIEGAVSAGAKGFWITTYKSISKPDNLAAYAKIAGPAIEAHGGRFLVRGMPLRTFENGLMQRCVISAFASVAAAIAAHDSPAYQEALKALGDGADRDIRIVEGL